MISVLHVDDDTGILDLTRTFLERSSDISVECVESARIALEKIDSESYDVIISDYQMPGMDGIEFLKKLRERGDRTPFIIFTGKGREDVVIEAFDHGADYYIQKGGNPRAQYAELMQKIRKAADLRRAHEARQESEELLAQIIESLPDATFAIGTGGRVIAWNRAIEEMTGVSAEEMLGKGEYEYAIPFYGKRCPTLADMVLSPGTDAVQDHGTLHRRGDVLYLQTQFTRPDGQESFVWVKASPLYDRTGRLKGAIESIRDITRWKKMEETLRESEEKYRLLVENANEVIMVIQGGRIRFCNPRMATLLGRTPIDLDGRAIAGFIHPDDREMVMDQQRRRAAGEDAPTNYPFRIVSSTGTVHWVLVNSSRIVWEGRPGLLVLLSDISAQKQAEEDLAAANEELTSRIETIARQNEDLHAAYEQLAATEEELRQNYQELEQSQVLLSESEARYRLIVDAAQEGVWQMDGAMKTVFVNHAMAKMLGYTEEEMLGRDIRDFISEDELAEQDELIDLRREGTSSRYERTFVRKDGTPVIASVSATPVIDDEGHFRGSFAMLTEITDQKRAEEALRKSEERYRSLFDQSSEGIFFHDLEGNILAVNHAAVVQSGYDRDELLQMTVFDLHPADADDRDDILRQWHEWQPKQPVTLETVHRRKDGSVFPAEVRTGVVQIGDGRYILAFVRDITDRKTAEEALRRAHRQIQLLTGITRHDINNSIMIAGGYLDLMHDAGPGEPAEYLGKARRTLEKIQRRIEFTRQYEGLGSQEPRWLPVDAIVHSLEIPDPIRLETENIDYAVFCDPMAGRVLENLLDNTIRHGGAVTRIRVTGTETDDGLLITWEDDGVGIPDSDKERIFEWGYGKNTGLGLFLGREILALTGISIRETGTEGKGARFEISVPVTGYRTGTPPRGG